MIEHILPARVACTVVYDDSGDAVLFPEEEQAVARVVDKRRREFTAVRSCARRALADLGLPSVPILPGEMGAPRWPDGVVGSLTHCVGYRAAAVARAEDMVTVGIDAEPDGPLPEGVLALVARAEELVALGELHHASPEVYWDRVLFSAKETIYKAWFPLTHRWLGFEDASLALNLDGAFTARILVSNTPYAELSGRWAVADGLIATAIAVPRP
jgi:4'-phosphopantetheinyl transferase EntD